MSFLHHETLFRSPRAMVRLREAHVCVCGAGALGSHVAEGLARSGVGSLRVVDRDRVEERNLSTQPWHKSDVGAAKARLLAHAIYRAVGLQVDGKVKELRADNARSLLKGSDLVIDCFDNSASRAAVQTSCAEARLPCLHAGMASDYGEVVFDPGYRVPGAAQDDVCDYPLARNLATITASLACEAALRFLISGERRDLAFTFRDLRITAT